MADGPLVDDDGVTFALVDRYRRLAGVRLAQEVGLDDTAFSLDRTVWTLQIGRPPVDRIEYLFEIEDHNQRRATINDPANPRRVRGAFGDKSVVEFPGYRPPAWLGADRETGTSVPFEIRAPRLDDFVSGALWTPAGMPDEAEAPLLVVHDGPEFDALAGFTHYVAAAVAGGLLPPVRVALLGPGERNAWYAGNPAYATTLVDAVLPALPAAPARIGVGASLGALALLHTQLPTQRMRRAPFDALFLQSGSFFTTKLDPQESGFSGFGAVTGFVAALHNADEPAGGAIPVAMTCGLAEENLANNQAMAATLRRLGHPVEFSAVRDAHNYTAWRDAWHPHLTALISAAVASHAA
jgi:enterochelin esterase-like enzyme